MDNLLLGSAVGLLTGLAFVAIFLLARIRLVLTEIRDAVRQRANV